LIVASFDTLGFRWNRDVVPRRLPRASLERATFRFARMLPIPAVRATEFNSRMVEFYASRDATGMMAFVLDCHPEAAQIRGLNPELSGVGESAGIKYFRLDDPMPHSEPPPQPVSPEETRRKAAETWRREYYEKSSQEPQTPPLRGAKESIEKDPTRPEDDIGPQIDHEH
jgi:hypothetical protein